VLYLLPPFTKKLLFTISRYSKTRFQSLQAAEARAFPRIARAQVSEQHSQAWWNPAAPDLNSCTTRAQRADRIKSTVAYRGSALQTITATASAQQSDCLVASIMSACDRKRAIKPRETCVQSPVAKKPKPTPSAGKQTISLLCTCSAILSYSLFFKACSWRRSFVHVHLLRTLCLERRSGMPL
jgi:hypothetical protein